MPKLLSALIVVLAILAPFALVPVSGKDDVTFYGLKIGSSGPRLSGVQRMTVKNFPWLTTKNVQNQAALDALLQREAQRSDGSFRPAKPAIIFLASQKPGGEDTSLPRMEHAFFYQKDVTDRLDEYRWYWTYKDSIAGSLLARKYALKEKTALLVFEANGSLLHAESPVNGPKGVTRAMRMIELKRQVEKAITADIPYLKGELEQGDIKELIKYLRRAEKYKIYATETTEAVVAALRRALNERGEQRIKGAEELVATGEKSKALGILKDVKRDFQPLEVANRAEEVARRIRRKGS